MARERTPGGDAVGGDGALTDPSVVTAELPVVAGGPPSADEPTAEVPVGPGSPEPATGETATGQTAPASGLAVESSPASAIAAPLDGSEAEPPARRVIVIGDVDASTTGPTPGDRAAGDGPLDVPGPASLKHRGPLVFGDGGGTPNVGLLSGVEDDVDGAPAPGGDPRVVVIGDADEKPRDGEIDPRIKARRTQVRRSAGLRRLRAMVAIALALVLVFGGGTILRSYVLVVRKVVITGTTYTPPDHLQAAANSVAGRSMVDISLVELRKLVEASPWVKAVDVTRDWPSTIRIDVLERRPVAYYRGRDDKGYVVDSSGVVITATDGAPADYLEVTGALEPTPPGGVAPDVVRSGASVANALPASLRPLVATIDSQSVGVVLKLTGGKSRIVLGGTDDLAAKLVAVLALLPTCAPGAYDTLDVRVPGRPTVTPATACAAKKGA